MRVPGSMTIRTGIIRRPSSAWGIVPRGGTADNCSTIRSGGGVAQGTTLPTTIRVGHTMADTDIFRTAIRIMVVEAAM